MALASLWVYICLLIAGGLIGFIKAKSRASLITSWGFALALALCAINAFPFYLYPFFVAVLALFFGYRFQKTKKFMPAGLMLIASVIVLIVALVSRVVTVPTT